MSIIKLKTHHSDYIRDIAVWLDNKMPNPPMDEPQRWTLITEMHSIEFFNEKDALLFAMTW